MDRYFGHNHALANENNPKADKNSNKTSHARCAHTYHGNVYCQTREDPNRNFPQVRLSYSTSDRKVVLTHQAYAPPDDAEAEELIDLEVRKMSLIVLYFAVKSLAQLN